MKRLLYIILIACSLMLVGSAQSCTRHSDAWATLARVDSMIASHSDSAYILLQGIDRTGLAGDEERAKYALLMSMALDKNYIDTTEFDVIQPAIDYYATHGTPDDKLRTLYYQGVVHYNRNEFAPAMQSFLKAEELRDEITDTFTYANMLALQSTLFYRSYQMGNYALYNLRAACLFEKIRHQKYRQSCLIRALDGYVALNDKIRADSILALTHTFHPEFPESGKMLSLSKMAYGLRFDSESMIRQMTDTLLSFDHLQEEEKLNYALCYIRLGEPQRALSVFESIDSMGDFARTLRYHYVKPKVLKAVGDYKGALEALLQYLNLDEESDDIVFSQKTIVAQQQYASEIKNIREKHRYKITILTGACFVLTLLLIMAITYHGYCTAKAKKVLAETERERLRLEYENIQQNNEFLISENARIESEKKQQHLLSENLTMKISELEAERDNLKDLITHQKMSQEVKGAIRERIMMLNQMFASTIGSPGAFSSMCEQKIHDVIQDKESFLRSTQLAFRASHPDFMKYLDDHNLSKAEIDFICLYAIGLSAKEIGVYINTSRHYHISSGIRKKLCLGDDDSNLGNYIRNLMVSL